MGSQSRLLIVVVMGAENASKIESWFFPNLLLNWSANLFEQDLVFWKFRSRVVISFLFLLFLSIAQSH